ncbi:hypothetical protein DFH07DRAFT_263761 [Mycena maculata]|uniref:Transmembrane protein n=1 Tax=Mycena maculata TaxID=230809 RepID=A0AAD7HNG2_9AGAR|nr:hypothetical protein DFH07DRAFT_263761 [Mycena maculata]
MTGTVPRCGVCSAWVASSSTTHMLTRGTVLVSLALLLLRVASQTSNVTTCTPQYEWSLNSKGQTPCLVAAFLESVCEGPVEVNSIPPDTHYIGPVSSDATLCRCSTVTYSLISACGGCQSRTFITWSAWAANCTRVEVGEFLQPIPSQVVVPSWAYLDVTQTDNDFNPILANQSLSNSASSSATSVPVSSIISIIPSTSVPLPSTPPTLASHKKSNAGAIAGGVVGGLVGLVAISLAVLFFLRHRNLPLAESGQNPSVFSDSNDMHEFGSHRTAVSPLSITPFPYTEDSYEAGTFLGSPVTSAVHTTFDAPSVSTPAVQVLHRYTGSAEV